MKKFYTFLLSALMLCIFYVPAAAKESGENAYTVCIESVAEIDAVNNASVADAKITLSGELETNSGSTDSKKTDTEEKAPFNWGKKILISFGIALVVALIVTGSMISSMKSVRKEAKADNYIRPGSMHVTNSREFYLYKKLEKTKKEQPNS